MSRLFFEISTPFATMNCVRLWDTTRNTSSRSDFGSGCSHNLSPSGSTMCGVLCPNSLCKRKLARKLRRRKPWQKSQLRRRRRRNSRPRSQSTALNTDQLPATAFPTRTGRLRQNLNEDVAGILLDLCYYQPPRLDSSHFRRNSVMGVLLKRTSLLPSHK